jgi:hypothetical protein
LEIEMTTKEIEGGQAEEYPCCGNPEQCWEPCGDLGKSEKYAKAVNLDISKALEGIAD